MARKNTEIIRLTESDLHRIIENSVKTYLREEKVTEGIQYVIDVLKQNTRENIKDIKKIEQAMVQDSDIADIVYQLAFTDEKDNFVTINPNEIEEIDEDTYNILSQKIERETLVFMTYINEDQIVKNIIVPIDALEDALSRY